MGMLDRNMEHCWYRIDLNTIPQPQQEEHLGPCGGFIDWADLDDTALSPNMIPTALYPQSFDPNISTPPGTEQPSECSALSSPILPEALPCPKERRRAQNRDSQRSYRRRQACYIRTLEQELEETRAKNEKLRKCIERIKEAFCEVQKEDWAADCLESCSESLLSEDEKKGTRN
ncbi:hypothetical protein BKA65DRAFT_104899 [Rhexocercosporidium sp. MPI-PUGE-AT-0058]|nr:hypothetical protein BKA65DRAFT_104899 [Rhexocercosporidium sp. MPI-PUGE-AT-0058]